MKGGGGRRGGVSRGLPPSRLTRMFSFPFFFPLLPCHRVARHCTFLVLEFDALSPKKARDDDVVFLGEKVEVKLGSDLPVEHVPPVTLEADCPSGSDF